MAAERPSGTGQPISIRVQRDYYKTLCRTKIVVGTVSELLNYSGSSSMRMKNHSLRSAWMGSINAAWRAGSHEANATINKKTSAMPAKVSGSDDLTPTSKLEIP